MNGNLACDCQPSGDFKVRYLAKISFNAERAAMSFSLKSPVPATPL
jgi:hypothetical protein